MTLDQSADDRRDEQSAVSTDIPLPPQPAPAINDAAAWTDVIAPTPIPVTPTPPIATGTPQVPGSFDDVCCAVFYSQARFNEKGPENMRQWEEDIPAYMSAFQERFGRIERQFFCTNIVAAVAMTSQGRIFTVNNETPDDASAIVKLINDTEGLAIEVRSNFDGHKSLDQDRQVLLDMIYSTYSNLFALLDTTAIITDPAARADARSETAKALQNPASLLADARRYYERAAQRTAQLRYFRGMVVAGGSAIVAAGVFLAIFLSTAKASWLREEVTLVTGIFLCGAVGAIVSVMSRMTSSHLTLDHTTGWRHLARLGAFRPLIGATFGLVLYALVASRILPLAVPSDRKPGVYLFLGLAFLAGFSERFAQDMLSTASTNLGGKGDEQA
jgi:hypothetical protein